MKLIIQERIYLFLFFLVLFLPALSEGDSPQNAVTVKPPQMRTIDPNSFPTIVFVVSNNSEKVLEPEFRVSIPDDWEIISLKKPAVIEAGAKERVRITFLVPKFADADSTYIVELITEWDSQVNSSFAEININPKYDFSLITFSEEMQLFPGQMDSISYVVRNEGNIAEIIQMKAEMPNDWELIQLIDRFSLPAHEKETINLIFKIPGSAKDGSKENIRLTATSLNTDIEKTITTNITVTEIFERKIHRSLYPTAPIDLGFTLNNIKKDMYPELTVYVNTGYVDFGRYSSRIEFTEKSSSVGTDEFPEFFTERIKWELLSEKWGIVLGDVTIDYEPIMSTITPLSSTGFETLKKSGRGGRFKYMIDNAYFTLLYAKDEGEEIVSVLGDYLISDQVEIASSYLKNDEINLVELRGIYDTQRNFMIEGLGGTSKTSENDEPYQFGGEIGGSSEWNTFDLTGRVYGADSTYGGGNGGKTGAQLNTGWEPFSFLYLWNRINAYRIDSSSITDLKTRALFHFRKLPSFNFGYNYQRDMYSTGLDNEEKKFDFRIEQRCKIGTPSLYYSTESSTMPDAAIDENKTVLSAGWVSYFKSTRLSIKHGFMRNESEKWGYESNADISHGFKGLQLGVSGTYGKEWDEIKAGDFADNRIFDLGIHADFGITLWGLNLGVRTRAGNDFLGDDGWDFSISFSAGTGRSFQFDLPMPIIKTKGQLVGAVFIDKNGNRRRDVDEQGISQILILLDDEDVITDEDGKFEFSAMEPGDYSFSVNITTLPAYLALEEKIPRTVSIQKGIVNYIDIPVTSVCSISGSVYLDKNSNDKMDVIEEGISTIRLIIRNEKNQKWDVYTDRAGKYKATDMLPGIYTIRIDADWLPRRTLAGKTEWTAILTQNEPHEIINISAVNKVLQIKKTFVAPKKK